MCKLLSPRPQNRKLFSVSKQAILETTKSTPSIYNEKQKLYIDTVRIPS
jgi:hypothetical protein